MQQGIGQDSRGGGAAPRDHVFGPALVRHRAQAQRDEHLLISESLGHSNLAITENYLASFERDERMKNAQLLTKFD